MNSVPYVDLTYGRENIFDLANPSELTCNIYRAARGVSDLPMLWIQVVKEATLIRPFNLIFHSIGWFNGPTMWLGANFSVASQDENLEIFDTLGWLQNSAEDGVASLLDNYKLLTVKAEHPHYMIQLVTSDVYLSHTFPTSFEGV